MVKNIILTVVVTSAITIMLMLYLRQDTIITPNHEQTSAEVQIASAPLKNQAQIEESKIIHKDESKETHDEVVAESSVWDTHQQSFGVDVLKLSKNESDLAMKYINERGTVINGSATNNMSNERFEQLLTELSYINTAESVESTYKYTDVFTEGLESDTPFTLERLECGEAICLASIRYEDKDNLQELSISVMSMSSFDSKGVSFFGNGPNNAGFDSNNRIAVLFSSGGGKSSIFIPYPKK